MAKERKGWLGKILGMAVVSGLVAGCASVPEKKLIELMWPEPPQTTRIKFVRNMASEDDLGRKSSFRESLIKFITGKRPSINHLYQPMDIAVSDDGKRVYVSDYGQLMVYRFDLTTNKVSRFGPFDRPFGIALDEKENIYVVEQASKNIKVLDQAGKTVKVITHPDLTRPTDIAIDRKRGRIYVADPAILYSFNHFVWAFDMEGKLVRRIGEGQGHIEGQLYFPTYLALDKEGNIYVTETMNSRVSVFSPEGNFIKKLGERGNAFGMFDKPKGVALDSFGNVYVADSGWSNVQIFNSKGEVLLFFGGRGDYPGLLKNPTGIAIDKDNKIYVADYLHMQLAIYELVNTRPEDSYIKPQAKSDEAP